MLRFLADVSKFECFWPGLFWTFYGLFAAMKFRLLSDFIDLSINAPRIQIINIVFVVLSLISQSILING